MDLQPGCCTHTSDSRSAECTESGERGGLDGWDTERFRDQQLCNESIRDATLTHWTVCWRSGSPRPCWMSAPPPTKRRGACAALSRPFHTYGANPRDDEASAYVRALAGRRTRTAILRLTMGDAARQARLHALPLHRRPADSSRGPQLNLCLSLHPLQRFLDRSLCVHPRQVSSILG